MFFRNGDEKYLAIYDNSTGYVELFSENGGHFGYDLSRNRLAYGSGTNDPLTVKRILRLGLKPLTRGTELIKRNTHENKTKWK